MREPEGLGVLRTVGRAKVRQREVHVRELERHWASHTVQEQEVHARELGRLLRTRTRQVHTVQEPERLWASYTVRELDRLLAAVTRHVHTVREQEVLVKLLEPL